MTEEPVRILIINDSLRAFVVQQHLFQNAGITPEVVMAQTVGEGFRQLEKWAAEGHAADIVDIDDNVPIDPNEGGEITWLQGLERRQDYGSNNGIRSVEKLMEWAETQDPAVRPRKFFVHSSNYGDVKMDLEEYALKDKGVTAHDAAEFVEIASVGDRGIRHIDEYTTLREYMNRAHGATFALNEMDLVLQKNPDATFDLPEAYYAGLEGRLSREDAIRKMDLSHEFNNVSRHVEERDLPEELKRQRIEFDRGNTPAISGRLAFSHEEVEQLRTEYPDDPVILVLKDFNPLDVQVLDKIDGLILTGRGSEHLLPLVENHGIPAAIANRDGTVFVLGPDGNKQLHMRNVHRDVEVTINSGEFATITHHVVITGEREGRIIKSSVYPGKLPIVESDISKSYWYEDINSWVEELSAEHPVMQVKANADSAKQVRKAISSGAAGIGLVRAEHMFFEPEKLSALQDVLLTDSASDRVEALAKLKEFQKVDFTEIYNAAASADRPFPVTIRLLDAPPEEVLQAEQVETFRARVGGGNERGVQTAKATPGLYIAQAEAIMEAAKASNYTNDIEVLVPTVRTPGEFALAKSEVMEVAKRYGLQDRVRVGSMMETLDAVKNAAAIAEEADFMSFGTNDLTQEVMGGIKRTDVEATNKWMVKHNHVGKNPFLRLSDPVVELMRETIESAHGVKPDLPINVCGNHVRNDESSLAACHALGVDSVSMAGGLNEIFTARLSALQQQLRHPRGAEHGNPEETVLPKDVKRDGKAAGEDHSPE